MSGFALNKIGTYRKKLLWFLFRNAVCKREIFIFYRSDSVRIGCQCPQVQGTIVISYVGAPVERKFSGSAWIPFVDHKKTFYLPQPPIDWIASREIAADRSHPRSRTAPYR